MQVVPPKPNLEKTMDNFISAQTQQNKEFLNKNIHINELITQLGNKVDQIVTHNKMLESHISQVAQTQAPQTTPGGKFPGQPQPNPKGQANSITLQSGAAYDGPTNPTLSVAKQLKESVVPSDQVEEPEEP